ncbi:hypothetical protein Q7P35_011433 [Cladosporium inversicolor]
MASPTRASMDSQKRGSQDSGKRRPSDAARFSKITEMKRSPTNDNAAARRASWEEQTIPRGAGILGDMWNKFTRGTETKK